MAQCKEKPKGDKYGFTYFARMMNEGKGVAPLGSDSRRRPDRAALEVGRLPLCPYHTLCASSSMASLCPSLALCSLLVWVADLSFRSLELVQRLCSCNSSCS